MPNINYNSVFQKIPSITGLDFVRKGPNWVGAFYMTGEDHSRHDKTVCYMLNGRVYIHENGSDTMSIWDWLLQHGGCTDNKQVYDLLTGEDVFRAPIIQPKRCVEEGKFVPKDYVKKLEGRYYGELFMFLSNIYGGKETRKAWRDYRVGVLYEEAIFFYINQDGNVCHDNRIRYDKTGHRIKECPPTRKFQVGDGFTNICLFGGHLPVRKTIVVESEKTAIIGALSYPLFRWVATGGMNKIYQCKDKGYILAPDFHDDAISLWKKQGDVWKWWANKDVKKNEDIGDLLLRMRSKQ